MELAVKKGKSHFSLHFLVQLYDLQNRAFRSSKASAGKLLLIACKVHTINWESDFIRAIMVDGEDFKMSGDNQGL